jgi:3',5'-cyclic AMP phosphodiesterase CpdA
MLLCQISDPHVVDRGTLAYGKVDTAAHLERCVRRIRSLSRRPDAVIATGDLTDNARASEYGALAEILSPLDMPLFLAVGNHDDRAALRAAFPGHRYLQGEDGFVQYVVDDFAARLVVLDTLVPGKPEGRLCERRLGWLNRTLAASRRPTIVAQHHPPFASGLSVMDRMNLVDPAAEGAVIARYPHVERVICGHQHRTAHAGFGGTVASICPSAAHQLRLDLVPDARIGFTLEPSGFQLHLWDGDRLVTHTVMVEEFPSWGAHD